jgi:hypothetical protein
MRLDWEGSKVCPQRCAVSTRVAAGRVAPGDDMLVRAVQAATLPAFCGEVCNFAQTLWAAPKDNEGPLNAELS